MPHEIIAEIEDKSGDKAQTSVWIPDATTLANATTFAAAWTTAMNDIIFGVIRGAWLRNPISVAPLTDNDLQEEADVEHCAKFKFRTVNSHDVVIHLPAVDEDVVAAYGSDEINLADTEVAAFVAAMESGISVTGGTIQPCDVGEGSIASTVFAREVFRNSGKRA